MSELINKMEELNEFLMYFCFILFIHIKLYEILFN